MKSEERAAVAADVRDADFETGGKVVAREVVVGGGDGVGIDAAVGIGSLERWW